MTVVSNFKFSTGAVRSELLKVEIFGFPSEISRLTNFIPPTRLICQHLFQPDLWPMTTSIWINVIKSSVWCHDYESEHIYRVTRASYKSPKLVMPVNGLGSVTPGWKSTIPNQTWSYLRTQAKNPKNSDLLSIESWTATIKNIKLVWRLTVPLAPVRVPSNGHLPRVSRQPHLPANYNFKNGAK